MVRARASGEAKWVGDGRAGQERGENHDSEHILRVV